MCQSLSWNLNVRTNAELFDVNTNLTVFFFPNLHLTSTSKEGGPYFGETQSKLPFTLSLTTSGSFATLVT